ncbi:FMN-binding negative transcriptional regulator [Paraburkholderia sp. BCC1886]|uniref:FMN-binding negative transcriptional regulator n=1 Tax=Paraburkholderia sp. BCC1886 TaxID=2562670 RepID=UPI0011837830|nr:FMN-binding negative transcriptional regulator [Paraburkholderia sp. BCC1886]
MYIKPAYAEDQLATLHAHMREWSFAMLVSSTRGAVGITHLPFLLDTTRGEHGTLTTHLARANPHFEQLREAKDVRVVFSGPHAFVSPSWYEDQHTFPTWNYAAIHASGRLRLIEEPEAVRDILTRTVAHYDTPLGGAWSFPGMPEDTILPRLKAIAGVEIELTRIEGKFKLNQDRSAADRHGVIAALETQGRCDTQALAALMRAREEGPSTS